MTTFYAIELTSPPDNAYQLRLQCSNGGFLPDFVNDQQGPISGMNCNNVVSEATRCILNVIAQYSDRLREIGDVIGCKCYTPHGGRDCTSTGSTNSTNYKQNLLSQFPRTIQTEQRFPQLVEDGSSFNGSVNITYIIIAVFVILLVLFIITGFVIWFKCKPSPQQRREASQRQRQATRGFDNIAMVPLQTDEGPSPSSTRSTVISKQSTLPLTSLTS